MTAKTLWFLWIDTVVKDLLIIDQKAILETAYQTDKCRDFYGHSLFGKLMKKLKEDSLSHSLT